VRDWFKSWCMRYVPVGPLAWLHGFRFARLVHELKQGPETTLLGMLLKPGDVAVDVGANGANWTWFLSQAVGMTGQVLAFEADPYYAHATYWAIRHMRLRNILLFPFGLSNHEETVYLRMFGDDGARFSDTSSVNRSCDSDSRGTPVWLIPLDSLVGKRPELARISLLKCDVEGYEWFVLQGAQTILGRARPILIFETGCYEAQGYRAEDLSRWLKERNYEILVLTREGRLAKVDAGLTHPDAATVNRIALPIERMEGYRVTLPFRMDGAVEPHEAVR